MHIARLTCCLQVGVVTSAVAAHEVSPAMAVVVEVDVPMAPQGVTTMVAEAMVDAAPISM